MTINPQRNYGVDLLRLVSMVMVVVLHVLGKGDLIYNETLDPASITSQVLWLFEVGAYCAVNCYALVSGYVGAFARFRYSNVLLLWLQVVCYSVGITLLFSALGIITITPPDLIDAFFPVCNDRYWYFTAYFCMFFFIPILNAGIKALSVQRLTMIVTILLIVTSVIPTMKGYDVFYLYDGYHALWLICLYLTGGLIRKANPSFKGLGTVGLVLYLGMILITYLHTLHGDYYAVGDSEIYLVLLSYCSPTIVLAALGLLLFFSRLSLGRFSRIIQVCSPLYFAIYLIHEHPLVRDTFVVEQFGYLLDEPILNMLIHLAGIVASICIICMLVDAVRYGIFRVLKLRERLTALEDRFTAPYINSDER